MEPSRRAAQLIAESEGLLLDFDGPVCDVYAGSDPASIARDVAAAFNLDIDTDDPLDLITQALANGGPVGAIHQALTKTEIEAVHTARETSGVRRLLHSYPGALAIVSNNAAEAIEAWLDRVQLRGLVNAVTGRDPRHMKPDPAPLHVAASAIGIPLNKCVFIGDSLSDAQAAAMAGTNFIALANRPYKRQRFLEESESVIIAAIAQLVPLI